MERGDHQIGFQEMLATVLLWGTFRDVLTEALLTVYIDNDGVLLSLIKGSGGGPETNMLIGQMWLDFAFRTTGVGLARVESKSNVADGPTRDFFDVLVQLGALEVPAKLPTWAWDLWGDIADPTWNAACES